MSLFLQLLGNGLVQGAVAVLYAACFGFVYRSFRVFLSDAMRPIILAGAPKCTECQLGALPRCEIKVHLIGEIENRCTARDCPDLKFGIIGMTH